MRNPHRSCLFPTKNSIHSSAGAVLVAAADPLSVTAAETACTNFTQAADGIQWCDTKLGTGKTPKKGELIRYDATSYPKT